MSESEVSLVVEDVSDELLFLDFLGCVGHLFYCQAMYALFVAVVLVDFCGLLCLLLFMCVEC